MPVKESVDALAQTNENAPRSGLAQESADNDVRQDAEPDRGALVRRTEALPKVLSDTPTWSALELLKQFVTPTGCSLPPGMPYEMWLRFMGAIGEVHMASEWTVGDAYLYGETNYGEKASQGEAAAGRSPKRLQNVVRICGIIPVESRLKGIRSFSVFEAIAPVYFRDAEEGHSLLLEAEAGKLTGDEVKALLDARGLRLKAKEKSEPEQSWTAPVLRERAAETFPGKTEFRNSGQRYLAAFLESL